MCTILHTVHSFCVYKQKKSLSQLNEKNPLFAECYNFCNHIVNVKFFILDLPSTSYLAEITSYLRWPYKRFQEGLNLIKFSFFPTFFLVFSMPVIFCLISIGQKLKRNLYFSEIFAGIHIVFISY